MKKDNTSTIDDLFQAIRNGQLDRLKELLKLFDVNSLNRNNQNLLHELISSKQHSFMSFLLEQGINVNQQDTNGQSPLHYCGLYRDFESARMILEKGGTLNLSDNYGNQPLWTAVFNAKGIMYDVVELFILSGADVNHKNNVGRSPLDFAITINDLKLKGILER